MEDHPAQAFRRKKEFVGACGRAVGARSEGARDGQRGKHRSGDDRGAIFARNAGERGSRALAAPFPNAKGGVSVMLDVGANVDSKPEHLVQLR